MLSQIFLLIFLSILTYSQSRDCVLNSVTKEDAWDKVLHRDKLKNYKFYQPPRNQSCVIVKVNFDLKTFALDEYEGKFMAKMWSQMIWSDDRLTWLPESYGGISQIVVRLIDIWVPYLRLLNRVQPAFNSVKFTECIVYSSGEIVCVPEIVYESYCRAKLTNWPYDVQNCTLQFGSGHRLNIARFRFGELAVTLSDAEYASGWNIALSDLKEDPNSDIQLSISFLMERQAYGLVVILSSPCLIISILTTTLILLNVNDSVRLGISSFSLICNFAFLFAIDEFLPKHSSDTPVVLFFIRGSIILTITSVLVTYILSKIVRRNTVPFEWVSSLSDKVFGSFAQYLVFPRWYVNSDSKDMTVKNKEVWTNIANILNSGYLVIVVILYIAMFRVYMPKQPLAGE